MTHQDYTEAFSGLYIAPGYYMGGDRDGYRAYLKHLQGMVHPRTTEEYRLIGAWATLQWRFQCLTTTERDWWESYEVTMNAVNPVGEASMLDTDPFERLAVGFKAIRAWEKLVALEARLQRVEARLLPMMEALLARAEFSPAASCSPASSQSTTEYGSGKISSISGALSREFPGGVAPSPPQRGLSRPPLQPPASGLHPEPAYPYGSRQVQAGRRGE